MSHGHLPPLPCLTQIGIYALMTASLNIQCGFTGLVNFGPRLMSRRIRTTILGVHGYSPLVCIPTPLLVCVVAAVLIGQLRLRLRGDFLASSRRDARLVRGDSEGSRPRFEMMSPPLTTDPAAPLAARRVPPFA